MPDYPPDLAENSGLTLEQAHLRAAQDLDQAFCDGPVTKGQHLLCILGPQGLLGYLWYEIQTHGAAAFCSIFISCRRFRGAGFAVSGIKMFKPLTRP